MWDPHNPVMDVDSYKNGGHDEQLPPEMDGAYSYAESRGGRYSDITFFGLQAALMAMAERPVTHYDVDEALEFSPRHGVPFMEKAWRRVVNVYGGHLPLKIRAVAEGTILPTHNALVTVETTDPLCRALAGNRETNLLRSVWYPTTIASRLTPMKRGVKQMYDETADDYSGLPFAILDFLARGAPTRSAADVATSAYLAHFMGSDTMHGIRYTNHYYDCDMAGYSIRASEHSVTTAWGKERELERMNHYIDIAPEGSTISDVIDTWDCFKAAKMWVSLKDRLRAKNLTIVGRPDSGDINVVMPEIVSIFADGFGTTRNSKGFDVINGAKVLWGDGIDEETYLDPFKVAKDLRISSQSVLTGSGGGLAMKDIDRDTGKFAFKESAVRDGVGWRGVAKDPITDPGKKSKMGRLALIRDDIGGYHTVPECLTDIPRPRELLRTVYENGVISNAESIDMIRERIDSQL